MQTRPRSLSTQLNRLIASVAFLFAMSCVSLPVHATLIIDSDVDGVRGQILGLEDNATGSASAVNVLTAPDPLALSGDFVTGTVFSNQFTVSAGQVTSKSFQSRLFLLPASGGYTATTLSLRGSGASNFITEVFRAVSDNHGGTLLRESHFMRQDGVASFTSNQVPEPTVIALFGSGIIAFGLVRSKKKTVGLITSFDSNSG